MQQMLTSVHRTILFPTSEIMPTECNGLRLGPSAPSCQKGIVEYSKRPTNFRVAPSTGNNRDHFLQADLSGVTIERAELPNAENKKS